MAKPISNLRGKITARYPGAFPYKATRNSVHYTRPDGKRVAKIVGYPLLDSAGGEIDTGIVAGGIPNAPWLWVQETADTRVRFGNGSLNFNIGQLVEWTDKATGEVVVEVDPAYFRPTEVDLLIGDPSKAKKVLGWEATRSVEELCHDMVKADLERFIRDKHLMDAGHDIIQSHE